MFTKCYKRFFIKNQSEIKQSRRKSAVGLLPIKYQIFSVYQLPEILHAVEGRQIGIVCRAGIRIARA